jgi:hypothetical protein
LSSNGQLFFEISQKRGENPLKKASKSAF